jgi:hypothetical protein
MVEREARVRAALRLFFATGFLGIGLNPASACGWAERWALLVLLEDPFPAAASALWLKLVAAKLVKTPVCRSWQHRHNQITQGASFRSLTTRGGYVPAERWTPTHSNRKTGLAPSGNRVAAVILLIRSRPSLQPFAACASSKRNGR